MKNMLSIKLNFLSTWHHSKFLIMISMRIYYHYYWFNCNFNMEKINYKNLKYEILKKIQLLLYYNAFILLQFYVFKEHMGISVAISYTSAGSRNAYRL